eukprot:GHVH01013623.1.p1 GENE.GHVH01013623.1~~GHVH01013623.1.p1  ORF type:complete len:1014 (-),score=134.70 GHVH01013623.1:487-3528(-)
MSRFLSPLEIPYQFFKMTIRTHKDTFFHKSSRQLLKDATMRCIATLFALVEASLGGVANSNTTAPHGQPLKLKFEHNEFTVMNSLVDLARLTQQLGQKSVKSVRGPTPNQFTPPSDITGLVAEVFTCTVDPNHHEGKKGTRLCPMVKTAHRGFTGTLESTVTGIHRSKRVFVDRFMNKLSNFQTEDGEPSKGLTVDSSKTQWRHKHNPPPRPKPAKTVFETLKQVKAIKLSPIEELSFAIWVKGQGGTGHRKMNISLALTILNIEEFDMNSNEVNLLVNYDVQWLDESIYYKVITTGLCPIVDAADDIICVHIASWNDTEDHVPVPLSDAAPDSNPYIWTPRLSFINQFEPLVDENFSSAYRAQVFSYPFSVHYGYNVRWRRTRTVKAICKPSNEMFPYEQSVCSLIMSIDNLSEERVNIVDVKMYALIPNYRLHFNVTNSMFRVANASHEKTRMPMDKVEDFLPVHGYHLSSPSIQFAFTVRRSGMIVMTNVFIPVIEMLTISYIAYFMNIRSQDRINMSLTVILPLYVIIAESLSFRARADNVHPSLLLLTLCGMIAIFTTVHTTAIAWNHSRIEQENQMKIALNTEKKRRMALFFHTANSLENLANKLQIRFGVVDTVAGIQSSNRSHRNPEISASWRMIQDKTKPFFSVKSTRSLSRSGDSSRNSSIMGNSFSHPVTLPSLNNSLNAGLFKALDFTLNSTSLHNYAMSTETNRWGNKYQMVTQFLKSNRSDIGAAVKLAKLFEDVISDFEKKQNNAQYSSSMQQLSKAQAKTNVDWNQWRATDMKMLLTLAPDAAALNRDPEEMRKSRRYIKEGRQSQSDGLNETINWFVWCSMKSDDIDIHLLNPVPRELSSPSISSEKKDLIMALAYPCVVLSLVTLVFNVENFDYQKFKVDSYTMMVYIMTLSTIVMMAVLWMTTTTRQILNYRLHFKRMSNSVVNHFVPIAEHYEKTLSAKLTLPEPVSQPLLQKMDTVLSMEGESSSSNSLTKYEAKVNDTLCLYDEVDHSNFV